MLNSLIPRNHTMPVNRVSSFLDDFFAPLTVPTLAGLPLSMWEDENHIYVEVDAPGVTEKDIDVSVHEGTLTIRAERKREREGSLFEGRSYGRFEQQVSLPAQVDADQVEASLANGVLSIRLPKSPESKPRKITVKAE